MVKTKREIEQDLKLIDVVLVLVDARAPLSTQNPEINEIIKDKKKIILLNKSDLSEAEENKKWIQYFKNNNTEAICTDINAGKGINETIKLVEKFMEEEQKELAKKGRIGKAIRMSILGIPNVGKSSFINKVNKKSSAKVGNKPRCN